MKKYKIGVLLHLDFEKKPIFLPCELRALSLMLKDREDVESIKIFDWKKKQLSMPELFEFPYEHIDIRKDEDSEKIMDCDVIFTWALNRDFFAGAIDRKTMTLYRMISNFTNAGKLLVLRLSDYTHTINDYKNAIDRRNIYEYGRVEAGEDPSILPYFIINNKEKRHHLDDIPLWDYEKVLFLCNGNREISDWSWTTISARITFLQEERVKANTVYLSDDLLFQSSYFHSILPEKKVRTRDLYHVGGFNKLKVDRMYTLAKEIPYYITIRTTADQVNHYKKLRKIPNATIIDRPLYEKPMLEEMMNYKAYLFIGKGNTSSFYLNKTLYDAASARTPFVIYAGADREGIITKHFAEWTFDTAEDLTQLMNRLEKDPEGESAKQRKILLSLQSREDLFEKISTYFKDK